METGLQRRDFCTGSSSSHLPWLSLPWRFAQRVCCVRELRFCSLLQKTAVSIIHFTRSLVAVAQFTVKLGENAENKGAIV